MQVKLAYGKEGLDVELPDENIVKVLRTQKQDVVSNPFQLIDELLDKPTGSKPLKELARGKKSVCVVITDVTRPTPNEIILPPILKKIEEAGVAKEDIKILNATGLHEPNEGDVLRSMVGDYVYENYTIINHNARDDKELVYLGTTAAGSKVKLNKHYANAELKILTGLIEPHFMAGYSGGRKCICPGIVGAETICSMHSPKFLEDENSHVGVLEKNSFHEEILAVAKMAGGADFILNVLIDEEKNITQIVCGDMEEAHAEGIKMQSSVCVDTIDEEADIVITTNSGYPLDLNLYQTMKGMVVAMDAVKEGGTIIIASRCHTGIGGAEFIKMMDSFKGADDFIELITKGGFFEIDQWQIEEYCKALKKAEIMIYTEGVENERLARYGLIPVNSVEEGFAAALEKHGKNAKAAVIPKGPYVIPKVKNS